MRRKPKAARRYYFAYGSNCNLSQMAQRCPGATAVGAATLRNYTLEFNGVASIRRRNGATVDGVLWELTPECERSLDRYEGFPRFYGKMNVTVYTEDGEAIRTMVYVMTPDHSYPDMPSTAYYRSIEVGFMQNGIPTDTLEDALRDTRRRINMEMGGRRYEARQQAIW